MLAIIKTGGKQYIVKPGDKLKVEKLDKKPGEEFSFSDVLLVEKNKKLEIYKKYNLNLIELFEKDVSNLDDTLPAKLLEFHIPVE